MRRLVYYARRFIAVARKKGPSEALAMMKIVLASGSLLRRPPTYRTIQSHTFQPAGGRSQRMRHSNVRISVLMPVHDTPPQVLRAAIRSVVEQTYPGWELCICDDASTSLGTLAVLTEFHGIDARLKIVHAPENLHIARATNLAAEFATGHFVAFLDHDDLLAPDALECVVEAIERHPDADVLYTDEDKLESDGRRSEPYLKPDWSPEHLQSVMYILHLMVVRKSLFWELGGLRHRFTGAQDYDLALRATARARDVVHIPRVLYHWRKIHGSAAAVVDAKPTALLNGKAALQDFVDTSGAVGQVTDGLFPGTFRVRRPLDRARPVTLLVLSGARSRAVPGRGTILLALHTVESIVATSTFENYRIVVVDDGDLPQGARSRLQQLGASVVDYARPQPFNFPDKANYALGLVETEDVILLNDDVEVIAPDWIEALLEISRVPQIGIVGARLLYPSERTQHAGIVLGVNGVAAHIFHNLRADDIGYSGYTHLIRNYSAVTAAVMATRMSVVRQVGFFDRRMAVDYNDVDLCLRVREAGFRIAYTPYATLYHFERSSLVRKNVDPGDEEAFLSRWRHLVADDPFYNPKLPRDRTDCELFDW